MSAARKLTPERPLVVVTTRQPGTPAHAAQFVGDVAALLEAFLLPVTSKKGRCK